MKMSDEAKVIDDGGPAFPHGPLGSSIQHETGMITHQGNPSPGMSFRDWLAARFAVRLSERLLMEGQKSGGETRAMQLNKVTNDAYAWADATIAARKGESK